MTAEPDEDPQLRSVALKNARSIMLARDKAEKDLVEAKDALQRSQERLSAALHAAETGTFRWNMRSGALEWDQSLAGLFGLADATSIRTLDELIGIVHPADQAKVRAQCERCAAEGADFDFEFRINWSDASVRWLHGKGKTVRDAAGAPAYLTGAGIDITREKQAEETLRHSAQRFELALAAGHLGDWSWESASDILTLGPRAAGIFGFAEGRLMTWAQLREFLHPDDRERARIAFQDAAAGRADIDIEYRVNSAPGGERWIASRGRATCHADGSVSGMIGVVQDVTERKQAEEALRSSEERIRATFGQAAVGIAVASLEGRFTEMNERFARLLGYPSDELQGMTFMQITHPDDLERTRVEVERLRAGMVPHYSMEKRYLRKDGSVMWSKTTVTMLRNAAGQAERFVGVIDDITQRKQTEEALQRSEQFSRSIIQSSQDCIKVLTPAGALAWISDTGLSALAVDDPSTVLGKSWIDFWKGEDHALAGKAIQAALEGGTGSFVGCFPVQDQDRWWNVVVTPIRDAAGAIESLLAVSRDVTDRIMVEKALREETAVLEVLNRTGTTVASQLDLERIVQAVTDAGTEVTGAQFGAFFYNVTDSSGESFMLFTLSGAPRSAFEKFGQPRATPLFGPTFRGEAPIRLDDVLADPRYGRMGPGMPKGHLPVRSYLAVPVISRTGEVIGGLFFGHAEPARFTARGERIVVSMAAQAAIAIDNARLFESAQKAAEERNQLLESERAARGEAERMSAMKDEFLATLSHELRTPLSSILGWSQILRRGNVGAADLEKGIDTIERNARAQAQLIEDLLDMSRINSGKVRLDAQPVLPYSFIEAATQTVRPAAEAKGIRLEAILDPSAGPVYGDPGRLQQVVWNLLSNAIKFTPRDGKVQVVLERVNSHVEISVADTGIGIKPEFLDHVFERFRQADASTTRKFGGLGLGLSIVKHLVELHGGTIEVRSAGQNRGTTFIVKLPVAVLQRKDSVEDRVHPRAPRPVPADFHTVDLSGIRILIVDDEPDARALLERVLTECSATVISAASAGEALALIGSARATVLISDIGMPDTDGFELLRRVRRLPAQQGGVIPAIALTAFARAEDRTRALRAGFQVHVSKPVDPAELVVTVASVVGRARPPDAGETGDH